MQEELTNNGSDSAHVSMPEASVTDVAETLVEQHALYVMPNPAIDQVWLNYSPGLVRVCLMDALGRRVLEVAPQGATSTTLQIETLAPASYFLVVVDTQGQVHNRKLIKQ